ncbi:MAG: Ig-like domain-containing protein, partial [Limisphaerales bacterium]
MKTVQKVIMASALGLALTININAVAQIDTNLQFTAVHATVENAIQLFWASQSNHIYQVQYANALATNTDGSTAWQTLYDNYPSQGTNTFILDTGDYFQTPPIVHPKYSPMRFYRIVDEGTNDGESPTVTITAPTNGDVLSDVITISVSASSSYPIVNTKLYVDGQEMNPGNDGTYTINTCEWPNGPHTLFATATALSVYPGPRNNFPLIGRAVSSYVPVTFSNLISRIAFSQSFFEPSLGQTQEVTATFAANSDWTLQIIDESSNAVRTVTGSGNSLTFDWDGTGDGETNIPDGVYHYVISAETNGEADELISGGSSGSSGGSPPSPDSISSSPESWVMAADGNDAVPLALYPPGMDTNALTIFSATPSEIWAASSSFTTTSTFESEGVHPAYSGPAGQSSAAPSRPQTAPVKNQVDNFSICYFNFPNGRSLNVPGNGQPYPATGKVHLDGYTYS